jgi:hypothetical protein
MVPVPSILPGGQLKQKPPADDAPERNKYLVNAIQQKKDCQEMPKVGSVSILCYRELKSVQKPLKRTNASAAFIGRQECQ